MRQRLRGQAVVEFALILTLLTLMLALAIDFGRAFSAWIDIGNMARTGAQYGTLAPMLGVQDPTVIRNNMVQAALDEQQAIFGRTPNVCGRLFQETGTQNWNAQVRVVYDFQPILRIPPIPNSISISRDVTMRLQLVPVPMSAVAWNSGCA